MPAMLGKKLGMTQFLRTDGTMTCATVLEAGPCIVTDLRLQDKHGYVAAQIGYGDVKEKHVSKAYKMQLSKRNLPLKKWLREIRLTTNETYAIGQEIRVDAFKAGDAVDVEGTSIGKGFAGGMKRWHWRGGPGSHGSMFHRRVGSIGASSFPSRTWPGHHMPGHLGNVKKTIQNLEVLKVDAEKNLLVVKGSVPGGDNGLVYISTALKLPGGIKVKAAPKKSGSKDPLKASKQAAAGGTKKK